MTGNTSRTLAAIWIAALLVIASGCGYAQQSHFVRPDVSLGGYERFYVVQHENEDWGIADFIVKHLEAAGLVATAGAQSQVSDDAQVVVTYQDQYMWDLTMYMLTFKVDFRDARTEVLLASAQTYRTSTKRKDPETMVGEAVAAILDEHHETTR